MLAIVLSAGPDDASTTNETLVLAAAMLTGACIDWAGNTTESRQQLIRSVVALIATEPVRKVLN
jgi:hypothetical protein